MKTRFRTSFTVTSHVYDSDWQTDKERDGRVAADGCMNEWLAGYMDVDGLWAGWLVGCSPAWDA